MTDTQRHTPVERSAEWIYQGVWLILADLFKVPQHPPTLPVGADGFYRTFHPSRNYLTYLKTLFWIGALFFDLLLLGAWLFVFASNPVVAAFLAIPTLAVAVLPDIVAYVAVHLRYDTMWYVMTSRSLRVRRGIWEILEHTITFENVQDVKVTRNPLQQIFGFATIVVETAGSGTPQGENTHAVGNQVIMQGIANPEEIRDLILARVRATRSAGLGDELTPTSTRTWSPKHHALLAEIRNLLQTNAP